MSQSKIQTCRSDFIRCIYGAYTVFKRTPYDDKALCIKRCRIPYTDYTDFSRHTPSLGIQSQNYVKSTRARAHEMKMTPYNPYNPYKV